jgi:hypothetical protein
MKKVILYFEGAFRIKLKRLIVKFMVDGDNKLLYLGSKGMRIQFTNPSSIKYFVSRFIIYLN